MPPIETKAQLIVKLRESRLALEKAFAKVPLEAMGQPGVVGEWSAKDVLAHVARWYTDYAFHDGFGRNKIYNALVRKKRKP